VTRVQEWIKARHFVHVENKYINIMHLRYGCMFDLVHLIYKSRPNLKGEFKIIHQWAIYEHFQKYTAITVSITVTIQHIT